MKLKLNAVKCQLNFNKISKIDLKKSTVKLKIIDSRSSIKTFGRCMLTFKEKI